MVFAISEGFEQWLARYEEMLFCVVNVVKLRQGVYRVKEASDRHETLGGDRTCETTPVAQKEQQKDMI